MKNRFVIEPVPGQVNALIVNKKFKDVNPRVFGRHTCLPGNCFGPAVRNYYLIHYVASGEGVLTKSTCEYNVHAGQIFVIYPGEVTTYTADKENPWHYIWVGFDGRLGKMLEKLESPVLDFPHDLFFKMLEAEELVSMREEFLVGKVFELFSLLFEKKKQPNVIELVENYISTNYQGNVRIDEIAKLVKYDRRYLARIFKQRNGITLTEYIAEKKMNEAARLLEAGASVAETGKLLGYGDQFSFSKAFKRYWGISPQVYRINRNNDEGGAVQ